ncbi:MAG: (2Fe-2S)-binding protein [Bacteroidetes bacterium]|nr:MAG: (2Fe-2S)-binding protein [Bacteroidota bacterium]
MIEFILNNKLIQTGELPGTILLDFIRKNEKLYGTKIGCREGDCGACTVLVGKLVEGEIQYKSVVSCLTPLGNIVGRHVVTVEGLNGDNLSPVQSAFVDKNATQCGFCTPGFVVSLTGFSLSGIKTYKEAIGSISGNICRCTGYKSIERAVEIIVEKLKEQKPGNPLQWLIDNQFVPDYFKGIPKRLQNLSSFNNDIDVHKIMGGGTDLYVQNPDKVSESKLSFITNQNQQTEIIIQEEKCVNDAECTVSDLLQSKVLNGIMPNLQKYFKLVSSEQIRNMGTLGGNIVNASPIGDLSIFFLAFNSELTIIAENGNKRSILLKNFYKGYKEIELANGGIIESVQFNIPEKDFKFNFEKVSKRTHLDIASVNTAIYLVAEKGIVKNVRISVGGVAPIPLLLLKTGDFLKGKGLSMETIKKASEIINAEISPISDIRGSSDYKRLLLRQLFFQHFIEFFPEMFEIRSLV